MTGNELIKAVAEETLASQKTVRDVIQTTIEVIRDELARGGEVKILGFGSFVVKERSAREGRNPRTGETIDLPAMKTPHLVFGSAFKKAVRQ